MMECVVDGEYSSKTQKIKSELNSTLAIGLGGNPTATFPGALEETRIKEEHRSG